MWGGRYHEDQDIMKLNEDDGLEPLIIRDRDQTTRGRISKISVSVLVVMTVLVLALVSAGSMPCRSSSCGRNHPRILAM